MAVVTDIDQLSAAIAHATAPAFMLGAVAAFVSILITRMERIVDRNRALRAGSLADIEESMRDAIGKSYVRRMALLNAAVYFGVLSALVTAALLITAFLTALLGYGHGATVALMFVLALLLLMASLINLVREIRLHASMLSID
jgi:hypothetical protein